MEAVLLVVGDGHNGAVDRDLVEVRSAEPGELRVQVREEPGLEQRVVGDIDPRDDVADVEGGLLRLSEEVVRVSIEGELPDAAHRDKLLRDELRGIEQVKAETFGVRLLDDLEAEFVFGKLAGFDRFPEASAVEVRVGAGQLLGFVPGEGMDAGEGLPVELHEPASATAVHQPEGMHAEAFHGGVAPGDGAVGHDPHDHVRGFRGEANEIPERIVGGSRLGHFGIRLGLHRVDQVRELHTVLDEEDGDVVADQVKVAFLGVELHGEAADVPDGIG